MAEINDTSSTGAEGALTFDCAAALARCSNKFGHLEAILGEIAEMATIPGRDNIRIEKLAFAGQEIAADFELQALDWSDTVDDAERQRQEGGAA